MESPLEVHEQMKRLENIEDLASERLFENYLILNLKGADKRIDIESTDQESIAMKMGVAFPGMIYTFINMNETNLSQLENARTGKLVEFHDFTPILFCTSYNPSKKLIKGLNLNLLPKEERLKFLIAFYSHYDKFFERVEEKTEYQKQALNKKYIIASIIGKNPMIFQRFNKIYGARFEFAYRSYNLPNIRNYRMIEYEEWRYIPFYDAKHTVRKIGLQQIYDLYNVNKNKT